MYTYLSKLISLIVTQYVMESLQERREAIEMLRGTIYKVEAKYSPLGPLTACSFNCSDQSSQIIGATIIINHRKTTVSIILCVLYAF